MSPKKKSTSPKKSSSRSPTKKCKTVVKSTGVVCSRLATRGTKCGYHSTRRTPSPRSTVRAVPRLSDREMRQIYRNAYEKTGSYQRELTRYHNEQNRKDFPDPGVYDDYD